jgi:outer membrane protein assembly factor BamA
MNRHFATIGLILYVLIPFSLLHSAEALSSDPISTRFQQPKMPSVRTHLAGYPIAFYSNETGAAAGLASKLLLSGYSDQRVSSLTFVGYYTTNGQYSIKLKPELYMGSEKYKLSGKVQYKYANDPFFGIGNSTIIEDVVYYSSKFFKFDMSAQRRVLPNLYVGPQYNLAHNRLTDDSELIDNGLQTVRDGGLSSGIGIHLTYDTRDSNMYPIKGSYLEFSALTYQSFLESDYKFNSYFIDLCNYRTLFGDHVLALQGVFGVISGSPPFLLMNSLEDTLRGFSDNRFVDKNVAAFQAEYRLPLFLRLGAVGFVGVGQVGDKVSSFTLGGFKPSAGAGLRMTINREHRINLRIDYGRSADDSSFDINFMEYF